MDRLTRLVAEIIHDSMDTHISASWVANAVMKQLDPDRISPPDVYGGCNMHVRQIAREQLRKDHGTSPKDDLFPYLQARYPTAHSEDLDEPEYVLRDSMTDDDVSYNVARLRSEAEAKLRHADALEDWGRTRSYKVSA
jgi:hypothetical protein